MWLIRSKFTVLERLIPRLVPIDVVVRLEVIEVQHDQRQRSIEALRPIQLDAQELLEKPVIIEPGMARGVCQLLLERGLLGALGEPLGAQGAPNHQPQEFERKRLGEVISRT